MSILSILISNAIKQVFNEKPDTAEEFAARVMANLLGNGEVPAEAPAKKAKASKKAAASDSEEPKEKKARPPMSAEHKAKLLFAAKVARDPAVKKAKEDLKAGSITKEEFETIKAEVADKMSAVGSQAASEDEAEPAKEEPKPEAKPEVIVIPAGPAVKAAAVAEKKAEKKAKKGDKKAEEKVETYVAADGDDQFDFDGDIYMVSKLGKVFETHEDDDGELVVGKQLGNMGFGKFAGMKESHRMTA